MRLLLRTAALALLAPLAATQVEVYKLKASDAAQNDLFGGPVDLNGNRILVGASSNDDFGQGSGAAYLFDAGTGLELFKLLASDGHQAQAFGGSVALSGDRAVVGASGDNQHAASAGAAYLIDVTTGQELFKLLAPSGVFQDRMGWSVDIDGNRTVISGPYADDIGIDSGAAYVFDVTTGQLLHQLVPSDLEAGDFFGYAVAIHGDRVLVSSLYDDDLGHKSGSVYVFDATTGQELLKLTASDGQAGDEFGVSLDLDGERAVVGSIYTDELGTSTGSAYVFDVTTGQELHNLSASAAAAGQFFGFTVAIEGKRLMVGAGGDDELGSSAGAAYVFDVTTGAELFRLTASDGEAYDQFRAVSIEGVLAVVGANGDDDIAQDSGAVYGFEFGGPIGSPYCGPAVPNSSGLPGTIAAEGYLLVSNSAVVLEATQLPANQFGYFLTSKTQGFVPNPGGSQGNLCLGGEIGRFNKRVLGSGSSGTMVLSIDLNDMPTFSDTVVQPGETWSFTAWFRDQNPGSTSNFTNGVAITFQ